MNIQKITIHNFRSIKDASFNLLNYSLLVGENNSGKSSVLTALRILYDDSIKFENSRDFPKFKTHDEESWIEIEFLTDDLEQKALKDEYKSKDKILKIRRYFKSKSKVKSAQSNIYAYENGILSDNLFYGAKNVSEAKIGRIIYIPEISKTDDNLKLSGPSPLRNLINFVVEKIIEKSKSYEKLTSAFDTFNTNFKSETLDGYSIDNLSKDVNENISNWDVEFDLIINNIKPPDIVKNLISHVIKDKNLDKEVDISTLGQGLQRQFIYTLIYLSSKYTDNKKAKKKDDFSPDFNFILFEEPEAFLHPSQQEFLNINLKKLANDETTQILITTHSSLFVSKNLIDLNCIIKLKKENAESRIYQINEKEINSLLDDGISLYKHFSKMLGETSTSKAMKESIKNSKLGELTPDIAKKLDEESLKYFLWLDSERSSLFFAKHVLICEGASEKILFDYLINTDWIDLKKKHIYFLDALGKFNIHRFMLLLEKFGINYSIIYDDDNNVSYHPEIKRFIDKYKGSFSKCEKIIPNDIEAFLGLTKPGRADQKPINILYGYKNGLLNKNLDDLKTFISSL